MKNFLQEKKLLILSGLTEQGKTFTAIRLLWEFFLNGYDCKFYNDETANQFIQGFSDNTDDKALVILDDLFGQKNYSRNSYLERDFDEILRALRKMQNTYIIITTKESIFQQFNEYKLFLLDLNEYKIIISPDHNSYDLEKKKIILERYAEKFNCVWKNNSELLGFLTRINSYFLEQLNPMRICKFAKQSKNLTIKEELKNLYEDYTKKTHRIYASVFQELEDDYLAFLILLITIDYSTTNLEELELVYNLMVLEELFHIQKEFNEIIKYFENDIIIIFPRGGVSLSHNSLNKAIEMLIFEDDSSLIFKQFLKILDILSQHADNYTNLAYSIFKYFKQLPNSIREDLLHSFIGIETPSYYLYRIIESYFIYIPKKIIIEIIEGIGISEDSVKPLLRLIFTFYDELPENIQEIPFQVADDKDLSFIMIDVLNIPNMESLTLENRNRLIEKLLQFDNNNTLVVYNLISHYSYGSFREESFPILESRYNEGLGLEALRRGILYNYKSLDENLHNLLKRLVNEHENLGVLTMKEIYDPLSSQIYFLTKFLSDLTDNNQLLPYIKLIVLKHFRNMNPVDREELILKIISYDDSNDFKENIIRDYGDELNREI